MYKKIFKYLCMLSLFTITMITSAVAYWRIEFNASGTSNMGVGQDDIAENYSFNENSNKYKTNKYTLYLFPSTIYLQSYLDYLDGKTTVKPEELYGYISPKLKEDGKIDYSPDGSVEYQCNAVDLGDDSYLDKWLDAKNGIYGNSYLSSSTNEINNYYQNVYENSNWLSKTGASSYDYGDPEYDQTQVTYSSYTTYDEQHNYRNLHRYDRFGYWPKVKKNEGRYLPLKIEANETFSSSFYEEVVKRPLSDMGDPHNWYCYSFTLWSYVSITTDEDGNRTGYQAPYYATNQFISNLSLDSNKSLYGSNGIVNPALSSFCPTAVAQYFDLMGDFSQYTDEEGIIRLFPKFSNGKTYSETGSDSASVGDSTYPRGFLNGGTDAVRMIPSYKQGTVFDQHDYYLSYLTDLENYNSVSNVGVSILTNVALELYDHINIEITPTVGYANWGGGWENTFTMSKDMISDIVSIYGEGFYNIYVFLGDIGTNGSSSNTGTNAFKELISTLRSSSPDDGLFKALAGKNFYEPLDPTTISDKYSSNKPVCLAIEKVRDARVIMNLSSNTILESQLQSKYEFTNQYFRYLSDDVYTTTAGLNEVENMQSSSPLNQRYQYTYILNGVDFTNASTPYFQIRFQKKYRTDIHFRGTGGIDGKNGDYAPNIDLIYNPDQDGKFAKEQRFVNAFQHYFNAEAKTISNGDTSEEQIVFSLKNEEYRGIYNLILVFIPNVFYSSTSSDGRTSIYYSKDSLPANYLEHQSGFYIYAYRETNVFLKIMANQPTEHYQLDEEDTKAYLNGFLIHDNQASNNMLIFQKEYALGVTTKNIDINEVESYYSVEYLENYTKPSMGWMLATCVNGYVVEWMKNDSKAPNSIKNVVLRDHVTGAIVATYHSVIPTEEELKVHQADHYYILENNVYYQLQFEDFFIRKNYVFYITNI